VHLSGTKPHLEAVVNTKDAAHCGAKLIDNRVLVNDSRLANAVAWVDVKDTPNHRVMDARLASVEISKCGFSPRVLVARPGDVLQVVNQDPILHNPRVALGDKTLFNVALHDKGSQMRRLIRDSGRYVVHCDVHEFMRAHVFVVDRGRAAVTDSSGVARIAGVPPGSYTLRVWHEVLGTRSTKVKVDAGKAARVVLDFSGKSVGGLKLGGK
jgi:plastocyanin